jgi:hypothetical protein
MRLRRGLLGFTVLMVLWCVAIALTGGFAFQVAGVRVSSRNPWNPLLLAVASAVGVIALSGRDVRRFVLADIQWVQPYVHRAYSTASAAPLARRLNPAVVIAVVGAVVQLYQWWAARPFWVDEEMIAVNIRDRSFADLAGLLWLDQSAPLGWLEVQRLALLTLNESERALRLVPVAFNVAMLAAATWAGRRWMSPAGAAALVLLCSSGQWVSHYSLELKHYSADIFFGLLLPALVVWVSEAHTPTHRLRRAAIWWTAAALGQWCANGAVLVAPASALVLWLTLWRKDGRRTAVVFAVMGMACLAVFGVHYLLSIRFTIGSGYLREYWWPGMPPASAGVVTAFGWLFRQAGPFAVTPGGSALELAVLFWGTSIGGFLFGRPRLLGSLFAAVLISACALALIRLVPLYERLGLWTVPALYGGIALAVDAGIRWARDGYREKILARAALGVILAGCGLWVCIDVAARGWRDVTTARPRDTNHSVDDRTGVTWLLTRKQPGDAVLTTTLGLPAVWWYGGASVAPPASGGFLPEGNRILEVSDNPGASCDEDALGRALAGHDRALVYLGFGVDDTPQGFGDRLLQQLRVLGSVSEFQLFTGSTRAAVVELGRAPRSPAPAPSSTGADVFRGCVSVRPARRW